MPKNIKDTIGKYFETKFSEDTLDNISNKISFDPKRQFTNVEYYDAYSDEFRLPFGLYFKIGKKKYFIYYSDLQTPLVYCDGYLYFPAGNFFIDLTNEEKYKDKNVTWYLKSNYRKYKLR